MTDELTPRQAAERIGANTRSVQRWIATGRLPARRIGGRWRVAIDAIDAFRTTQPPPDPAGTPVARSPIRVVFVANRGEIARRIARTAGRMGIRTVIPGEGGVAPVDLLNPSAVVAAADVANADAIHPGYGFLAENAEFAAAVEASGIAWIGPAADAIRLMGDKAAARRLATRLNVPVVPGYDDANQSDAVLRRAARRIGLPLLIKPAAGGGGKGMRVIRDFDRLTDGLAAARREATASFGDDRLILERFVEGPRHVEVQVLFDASGQGVALGERDCSIQRRHQKILEETPSPAVNADLRQRLFDASVRLASAAGYRSAGTCEFLVSDDGQFHFLEMNTRLQVEHPVTELVTGRDLVADQIRIAEGATLGELGLAANAPASSPATGHAVEVRLYAEDAEQGFLPATGTVELLRWPPGAEAFGPVGSSGVRIDSGIEQGTQVDERFDPLLAKVISWGPDRVVAMQRLSDTLDRIVLLGVVTNLRFLRWLVRQPVVVAGDARIDTLDRIWPPDDWSAQTALTDDEWQTAARALGVDDARDPWSGGWRVTGGPVVRLEADGSIQRIVLESHARSGPRPARVRVGETVHLDAAGRSVAFRLAPPPDVDRAARAAASHGQTGGRSDVESPMPGQVLSVDVVEGQAVSGGDALVTLEAMKMEHVVVAPAPGRVEDLDVKRGDQVRRGQRLMTIAG